MPGYIVKLDPAVSGTTLPEAANAMVVFAEDTDDAKAICKAKHTGASDEAWENATVTEIAAMADMDGWTMRIKILDASPLIDVSIVGAAADTIDDLGDAMVIALNADDQIAGAAYDDTTQILTIAETTDTLGDKMVEVEFIPPNGFAAIPGFVASITDEGVAGAALLATLAADAFAIPQVMDVVKI